MDTIGRMPNEPRPSNDVNPGKGIKATPAPIERAHWHQSFGSLRKSIGINHFHAGVPAPLKTKSDVNDFFSEMNDEIYVMCLFRCRGRRDLAGDLQQTLFVSCTQSVANSPIDNAWQFLWAAARNRNIDIARSETHQKELVNSLTIRVAEAAPDASPLEMLEVEEEILVVRKLLRKLHPRHRKAFTDQFFGGHSNTAAANRLGVSESTTWGWVNDEILPLLRIHLNLHRRRAEDKP